MRRNKNNRNSDHALLKHQGQPMQKITYVQISIFAERPFWWFYPWRRC